MVRKTTKSHTRRQFLGLAAKASLAALVLQATPDLLHQLAGAAPFGALQQLTPRLASRIASYPGVAALSVTDLATGEHVSINGDRPQVGACTINLFLLFSAQWGSGGPASQSEPLEEYTRIGFWSDLDYLGIAAYFDLAPSTDVRPTREEIRRTWEEWRNREISPFQAAHGKPLLFTEVGYRSTSGAAARPWDESLFNGVDLALQADLYSALFEAWRNVPWFRGVYFWYWSTNPNAGGGSDPGYAPQGKPAEEVVREWFGRIPSAGAVAPIQLVARKSHQALA